MLLMNGENYNSPRVFRFTVIELLCLGCLMGASSKSAKQISSQTQPFRSVSRNARIELFHYVSNILLSDTKSFS